MELDRICWGDAHGKISVDQGIESFLADVLALAGENPDAIREGVRIALLDCEATFRAQETNKTMSLRTVSSASECQGDAPG